MKVIVLGAGILGTATAYYLNQQGCDVTVVERQSQAASETSFANGGQISVSHAEPWANPSAPLKVLKWLGKEDAPLLFRLRADWRQWAWSLQFLRECTPAKTRHNIRQMVNLGTYSRDTLQHLVAHEGIEYNRETKGILHFFTNAKEFEAALEPAEQMRALGCERRVISAQEAVQIEPALAHIGPRIAGATFTAEDESGDAKLFTRALAQRCTERGVQFLYNHTVQKLRHTGTGAAKQVTGVEVVTDEGRYTTLQADAYVLAMGSYSAALAAQIGQQLLIYPAKGYSATIPVLKPEAVPEKSLTDDEYKLVFSRYKTPHSSQASDSLRIAGTAELNGYDRSLNPVRCQAIVKRVAQLFPGALDLEKTQFWTGLRPATPSNVPYIGQSRVSNVFLNTGHGTLGWTHGCGSGKVLAELICGKKPEVDFAIRGVR